MTGALAKKILLIFSFINSFFFLAGLKISHCFIVIEILGFLLCESSRSAAALGNIFLSF